MPHIPLIVGLGLALCQGALAQNPPPASPNAPLRLTLADAMERARANSPQILSANIAALLAREDTVQARAALLPGVSSFNQFIYTQPNGTPSGAFVSNDGVHVYNNQAIVHGDIFDLEKRADYRKTQVAEAVARAKAEIAARGLVATVTENYYAMVSAMRKFANAQQSQREAEQFLDITRKQERGGEVAHSDSVKAEIQFVQRQRETEEAQLALDKARIGLAVLLFPDFRQDFTVVDDLDTPRPAARLQRRFRRWPARKVPISAPPRPPWSSSGGKSNRPAPPCCPPYPPITSSASMPTSSPSIIPKATATSRRWSRPS